MKIHFLVLPLSWTQLYIQSLIFVGISLHVTVNLFKEEKQFLVVKLSALRKEHGGTTLGFRGVP